MPSLVHLTKVLQLSRILDKPIMFVVVMQSQETNQQYVKGEYNTLLKASDAAFTGEIGSSENQWWIECRIGDCVRVLLDCPYNIQHVHHIKRLFAGE
jgi:hypothetical protein